MLIEAMASEAFIHHGPFSRTQCPITNKPDYSGRCRPPIQIDAAYISCQLAISSEYTFVPISLITLNQLDRLAGPSTYTIADAGRFDVMFQVFSLAILSAHFVLFSALYHMQFLTSTSITPVSSVLWTTPDPSGPIYSLRSSFSRALRLRRASHVAGSMIFHAYLRNFPSKLPGTRFTRFARRNSFPLICGG